MIPNLVVLAIVIVAIWVNFINWISPPERLEQYRKKSRRRSPVSTKAKVEAVVKGASSKKNTTYVRKRSREN